MGVEFSPSKIGVCAGSSTRKQPLFYLILSPIQLRDYQVKFIAAIRQALVNHKRIIACAATGSGKTKTFISMVRMVLDRNATKPLTDRVAVLILTESTKIFDQIRKEQHGRLISAGTHQLMIEPGGVYVAMVQTLARRPGMITQFKQLGSQLLIINDEAHIGTSTKLLLSIIRRTDETFNDTMTIGFTATPDARSGKHIPSLYQHVVIGPQPAELVNDGHLSPYRHFARVGMDADALKIQNGEFTEASQEQAFGTRRVYEGLFDDLRTLPFKKCLIFTASINHAQTVLAKLTEAGFVATEVHSKAPTPNLQEFMFGTTDICVTVGMLTKGFDYPPVDLIVLDRKTKSLPLFLQMIGRGSRTSTETAKTHFTVLDYGENFKEHGLWDMERDWVRLAFPPPKKKKDGVAPIKICPGCEAIVPATACECKFCGFVIEVVEDEPTPEPSKLVEVTHMYERLKGRMVSTLSPDELAIYAKLKNKKGYAMRVAKARDQEEPGWLGHFGAAMNYKPYWAKINEPAREPKIEFYDTVLR